IGLGAGGWLGNAIQGGTTPIPHLATTDVLMLISAGLLVGFGTRLGSGCTSGHGVCGSARLSKRSISATAIFIVIGMLTATLVHAS
ncbi:MAG: YeeE/YedE thiosulfate transporter family protein, partial [Gammaproteobacteria bacterium]|nr:YeeE/YedE thiosulfate transporter family protein [Gammaproteobacteria bacterium]